MKTLRKTVCLFVVLALMFTLSLGVFAGSDTPHTITITNPDAGEPHTYAAYQVFSGDYDESTTALSNVSWGSGVNGDALLADLRASISDFASCETAAQVVQVLTGYASDSDEIRAFAKVVARNTTTPAGTATGDKNNPAVINVVGDGYYFVEDCSENLGIDTYSDYILLVEGDVSIEAKDTTGVVSQKKVKDINDSTLEGSDWQDSADYDIGDPVPFQLSGTVSSDYDKYDFYTLIFHDKESEGLTFDHITGVYVDGVEITGGFELVKENLNDGCTFEVRFADLKEIPEVKGGSVITVEYESILNDNAVIGEPGNPNEMRMEYSNNPTDESSTGFTPWDKVIVFTYEVIVNKVDEDGKPLTGAMFQLEKWIIDDEHPEGHWVVVEGVEVNGDSSVAGDGPVSKINGKPVREYTDPSTGILYYVIRDKANDATEESDIYLKASQVDALPAELIATGIGIPYYEMRNGQIVQVAGNFSYTISNLERSTTAGTSFTWKGVDDGHYRITETVTPPGFNTIEPIVFDVIAEHEEESENPVLISVDGDPFLPTEENMGILVAEVENHSGGVLPTTGGIGTTLFYVLGALLVLGAGVLLVVKKFSDAN